MHDYFCDICFGKTKNRRVWVIEKWRMIVIIAFIVNFYKWGSHKTFSLWTEFLQRQNSYSEKCAIKGKRIVLKEYKNTRNKIEYLVFVLYYLFLATHKEIPSNCAWYLSILICTNLLSIRIYILVNESVLRH